MKLENKDYLEAGEALSKGFEITVSEMCSGIKK
jgi:hypothetical protein